MSKAIKHLRRSLVDAFFYVCANVTLPSITPQLFKDKEKKQSMW